MVPGRCIGHIGDSDGGLWKRLESDSPAMGLYERRKIWTHRVNAKIDNSITLVARDLRVTAKSYTFLFVLGGSNVVIDQERNNSVPRQKD